MNTTPIDAIFDENNSENITLYNENSEPVEFEQIAVIPHDGCLYVILKPVVPMDGMNPDEALAFEILEDDEGEAYLEICTDEDIVNQVFDIYDELVESAD